MKFYKFLRNLFLYLSKRRGAKKAWKNRHGIVFKRHPGYKKLPGRGIIKEHIQYWSPFTRKPDLATLQICCSISGSCNPQIVPEEIFQTDIEPTLNSLPECHFFANKSYYNRWFGTGIFPGDYFHSIDGRFFDCHLDQIDFTKVTHLAGTLSYPVVLKPNVNSYGGRNILFVRSAEELLEYVRQRDNFVVQEMLYQHPSLGRLHPQSINTVRVYIYISVRDNSPHIINMAQRTGVSSCVDNVATGGLVSFIRENGVLNGYALDKYGGKYEKHPVTGLAFEQELPDFEGLKTLSMDIVNKLFHLRIAGLDLYYDRAGCWKAVEVNTYSHSIRFAQYAGQPFFGDFTDEVIEYCMENHWARS